MNQPLRQAVQALQQRDFETAVKQCRAFLQDQPDNFDGLHLLGIALCEAGQIDQGRQAIEQAVGLNPRNPEPHYNLGNIWLARAELEPAEDCFRRAIELAPGHFSAWNNLGSVLTDSGQSELAIAAYEQVNRLCPEHPGAYRNLGNLLFESGQLSEAEAAFGQSLKLQPDNLQALRGLGSVLQATGRSAEARTLVEQSLQRRPDEPHLLNILGAILLQNADNIAAETVLRRAVKADQNHVDAWDNLGLALGNQGQTDEARACYETALALAPKHLQARANLANLLEMLSQLDNAREIAEQGLQDYPDHQALNVVVAKCDRRQGRVQQAADRLIDLIERSGNDVSSKVHFQLGHLYDNLGKYELAFAQFQLANTGAGDWWRSVDGRQDTYLQAVAALQSKFTSQWVAQWTSLEPIPDSPVFLLGFQRSGTTLLDTVLDSHPRIQVLEEAPAIQAVVDELAAGPGYPDALAKMSAEQASHLRSVYFEAVDRAITRKPACLLVDKSPLHSAHLGLIERLFPGTPVVMALRHPLDVCLSCFMQDFKMTAFMTNFLSVEGAAKAYQAIMQLARTYERLLPLNLYQIRYEDLTENFQAEMQHLIEFLGLQWDDRLLKFDQHAVTRGLIDTPSYHQVSQPIYQSARYRWRNYQDQLRSVMTGLEPDIRAFGYTTEPNKSI